MENLKELTDDELDQHRRDVAKEITRRAKLKSIPEEIDSLRSEYTAAGGKLADLDKGE